MKAFFTKYKYVLIFLVILICGFILLNVFSSAYANDQTENDKILENLDNLKVELTQATDEDSDFTDSNLDLKATDNQIVYGIKITNENDQDTVVKVVGSIPKDTQYVEDSAKEDSTIIDKDDITVDSETIEINSVSIPAKDSVNLTYTIQFNNSKVFNIKNTVSIEDNDIALESNTLSANIAKTSKPNKEDKVDLTETDINNIPITSVTTDKLTTLDNDNSQTLSDDNTVNIDAEKVIINNSNGYKLSAGDFSFTVTPDEENPEGDPIPDIETVTNEADGTIPIINNVEFTEEGVYNYYVKEVQSSNLDKDYTIKYSDETYIVSIGISYDEDLPTVTETILDVDGAEVQPENFDFINTVSGGTAPAGTVSVLKEQSVNGGNFTKDTQEVNTADLVTYKITIINETNNELNNIDISDVVPTGMEVNTASISSNGSLNDGTITWEIPYLAAQGSVAVTFNVNVLFNESINSWVNTAIVTADELTQSIYSNTVTLESNLPGIYFVLNQELNNQMPTYKDILVKQNDTVTYKIEIINFRDEPLNNLVITDPVSKVLSINATSINNGGTVNDNTITWNLSTLEPGDSRVFTFSVVVPSYNQDLINGIPNQVFLSQGNSSAEPVTQEDNAAVQSNIVRLVYENAGNLTPVVNTNTTTYITPGYSTTSTTTTTSPKTGLETDLLPYIGAVVAIVGLYLINRYRKRTYHRYSGKF